MRAPLENPADTVASLAATEGRLVVVTGGRGAGKTTWCSGLVDEARARGVAVAGVLSPHVLDDGVRVAIELVDVVTGERRRLASGRGAGAPPSSHLPRARWIFDDDALSWGNAVLDHIPPEADLLVLDEMGVLELQHGVGLASGLALVDARRHRTACVVVRPELVERACDRWPWAEVRWAGDGS